VEFEGEEGDGHGAASLAVGRSSLAKSHSLKRQWRTTDDDLLGERPTANDVSSFFLHHRFRGHLRRDEGFDDVADLDVAVVRDRDAAFHAVSDFFGVIFEAA
jgi:hypothetical protein